jgi:hypothetical protein
LKGWFTALHLKGTQMSSKNGAKKSHRWELLRFFAFITALPTLFRAMLLSDAALLAKDSESTFFRFFRSKHITDLQRLAQWATFLLLLFVPILTLAMWGDAVGIDRKADHEQFGVLKLVLTYFGSAFAAYGALLSWAYLSASSRLGVVDLFACEIITLCRVGLTFDIGKHYVEQYNNPFTTATFASEEHYFPLFDNNSRDLQLLESSLVNDITAFYTYMKATRDSLRRLALIKLSKSESLTIPDEIALTAWKATMFNVIYVLFLSFESGRKAIDQLIEYEPRAAENKMVMLINELTLYSFLVGHFERQARPEQDQFWSSRLALRRKEYETEVSALFKQVSDVVNEYKQDKDSAWCKQHTKDWATAMLSVPELKKRYQNTFNTLPELPPKFPTDKALEQLAFEAAEDTQPTHRGRPHTSKSP